MSDPNTTRPSSVQAALRRLRLEKIQEARHSQSTKIDDPFIDYAKLAQGMGVQAEGPVSDPKLLAAAIARGMEVVKRGDPYLIDTVTQPR